MAWDFSTEPEFEEKLEWMRGFVREEIIPLGEPSTWTPAAFARATRPLKDEVKAAGTVGRAPAAGPRRRRVSGR